MDFFLALALIGLIISILAGIGFLLKRTVAPPKTPYDLWLDEARKQSAVKLNPNSVRTASRLMD
ncbi:MAG: hypothetical protein KJN60_05435 [Boseongicola sp.]|nr:hypothetical protein [Boseongicola sp.]